MLLVAFDTTGGPPCFGASIWLYGLNTGTLEPADVGGKILGPYHAFKERLLPALLRAVPIDTLCRMQARAMGPAARGCCRHAARAAHTRRVTDRPAAASQAMLARVYRAFLWQQPGGPQHASAYDLTMLLLCRRCCSASRSTRPRSSCLASSASRTSLWRTTRARRALFLVA